MVVILSVMFISLSSQADPNYYGCDKKIYQLEKQLRYAKMHNNHHRVAALERAISNVQNRCYDHYSGATGPTKLNGRYYSDESRQLEREIDALRDEIERLKSLKN